MDTYLPLAKVSGHTHIYCDNEGWIYKEYDLQEEQFYNRSLLRSDLLLFLPKYEGIKQISTSSLSRSSDSEVHRKMLDLEMKKQDQEIVTQLTRLHSRLSSESSPLSDDNIKDIHAEIKKLSLKRIDLGCNQTVIKKQTVGETSMSLSGLSSSALFNQ